jgi:hypothetical protein
MIRWIAPCSTVVRPVPSVSVLTKNDARYVSKRLMSAEVSWQQGRDANVTSKPHTCQCGGSEVRIIPAAKSSAEMGCEG